MFNPVTKTFQYGNQTVTLETGKIARQATGAVVVKINDTQVLATVVGRKQANTYLSITNPSPSRSYRGDRRSSKDLAIFLSNCC